MNLSNCSLECGSSAGTKEAAELYLEKVGTNLALFEFFSTKIRVLLLLGICLFLSDLCSELGLSAKGG